MDGVTGSIQYMHEDACPSTRLLSPTTFRPNASLPPHHDGGRKDITALSLTGAAFAAAALLGVCGVALARLLALATGRADRSVAGANAYEAIHTQRHVSTAGLRLARHCAQHARAAPSRPLIRNVNKLT